MSALVVAPRGGTVALLAPGPVITDVAPAGEAARTFHRSMPGYTPTPLTPAPAAAAALGVSEVWVKDESSRLGLPSFKVLGASYAVYRALLDRLARTPAQLPTFADLQRAIAPLRPLVLSAATDGNHGRAVARMASLLGLASRIYVPDNTAAARIEAIAGEGADVTAVDGGYNEAVRRSAADAGEDCLVISDTSWEGYQQVPRWVIEGYETVLAEIDEALAAAAHPAPDAVVVPIGVGALAAAVVRHVRSGDAASATAIVGVEPTAAACVLESVAAGDLVGLTHPQDSIMAGLNCDTPSLIAWPMVSRGIDVYVAVGDDRIGEATRLLATDGIVAGECGAAGLAGMLALAHDPEAAPARTALAARLGPEASLLLLCTEGATDPDAYRRLIAGER